MDNQKLSLQKGEEKIDKHRFYFETPLYEIIKIDRLENDIFEGDVDGYNFKAGYDTTYKIELNRISGYSWSDYYHFYTVTLTCKRNEKDKLKFFVYYNGEILVKVGQTPSLAAIHFAEINKKYGKFLSKEELEEFKKAIDLASNGHGVGSFVYLRRIFENLINTAFLSNKDNLKIREKEFQKLRMLEKIERLKEYLPSQLLEMKNIYKVLSKGVHELTEQECLRYFPALKLSIELILDQKIEEEIKRKRSFEVKKQIENIVRETITIKQ
jgi:hypothetical protein